ncbi:GD16861 [Drosophila simulans]|uniref:GD16861 n=1 Tax=Drosophila simulans TaxID=7240 RepID=B4R675_DROSI|nr:GD16861 [Drosophila simulans]
MRKVILGLPIWTPLFILFLLFLAGVWGKPSFGVNRHGLLDSYREQIHGTPLTRKEVECPEDGIKNAKQSRYDRSLNHQFNTVSDRLNQNENHFSLDADQFNRDADQLNRDANHFNVDTDNFSQHRDVDMFDNFQVNKPELVNNPMMDYKREFASDEANPYVESLQQRYEPLPHAFKD